MKNQKHSVFHAIYDKKIKQMNMSLNESAATSCSTKTYAKKTDLEKAVRGGGSMALKKWVVIVSVSLFSFYEAEERRPAITSALLIAMC